MLKHWVYLCVKLICVQSNNHPVQIIPYNDTKNYNNSTLGCQFLPSHFHQAQIKRGANWTCKNLTSLAWCSPLGLGLCWNSNQTIPDIQCISNSLRSLFMNFYCLLNCIKMNLFLIFIAMSEFLIDLFKHSKQANYKYTLHKNMFF